MVVETARQGQGGLAVTRRQVRALDRGVAAARDASVERVHCGAVGMDAARGRAEKRGVDAGPVHATRPSLGGAVVRGSAACAFPPPAFATQEVAGGR